MGLCASGFKDDDQPKKVPQNQPKEQKPSEEIKVNVPKADENPEDLFSDWRELVRSTMGLVLIPLYQSLEYEKDGYTEAANKRKFKNIAELSAPAHFEKFINEFLDVPAQPAPHVSSDEDPEVRRIISFLTAAKTAPFREPSATRETLTKKLQDATKQTIKELKESMNFCDASALKINLHFFSDLLSVFQGDISTVAKLSAQIEEKVNSEF